MLFDGKENKEKAIKVLNAVVDKVVRERIMERLFDKEGNYSKTKEALKELEDKPVWYNEEKRIPINTVRCFTGLSAVESVRKNERGKDISFVKPGNNHHLAIYFDEFGNKKLSICSFWHAVERKRYGLPVIIKNPLEAIDKILEVDEEKYPDSFLEKLPDSKWTFIESYQQNEMYVLGVSKEAFEEAITNNDYKFLSNYLYRVQKIFYNGKQLEIYFRSHLETKLDNDDNAEKGKRFYQVQSLAALEVLLPKKVLINCLGEIVKHN